MGFSECLQNNVDLSCLPFAYQNLKTKKPLTISTRKWFFYMVGPDVTILNFKYMFHIYLLLLNEI